MAISKATIKKNGYKLKGSLRKNGFDCWRYFFTGKNVTTGKEDCFFIELLIENPSISPNEFILTQKSRPKFKTEDLQAALTGNTKIRSMNAEETVVPSFVAVRAGIYGEKRKQINRFYNFSELTIDKKHFNMQINDIVFSDDTLNGSLSLTKSESVKYPEYMSQSGSIQWNLHYERVSDFPEIISKDDTSWLPGGIKTVFTGRIVIDDEEYSVTPKLCYGYSDKNWGKHFPIPFYHLASDKMTSIFSGKLMENSCFVVQGSYESKLFVLCKFEDEVFNFSPSGKFNKYSIIYNCAPVPGEEADEQLHWTISLTHKKYVCDIDIFCSAQMMLVRDYEIPEGNHKVQKVLSGSHGIGEIRLYKKFRKNLELIQHAKIENCISEFGTVDEKMQ